MDQPINQQAPVQQPLTLIVKIKSQADAQQLRSFLSRVQALPPDQNPVHQALTRVRILHFSRMTFLENDTRLAVITEYDGDFEAYVNHFVNEMGDVFNAILAHVEDAPPLPIQQHRDQFLRFIKAHDLPSASFFSAYPRLTVLDILALAEQDQ